MHPQQLYFVPTSTALISGVSTHLSGVAVDVGMLETRACCVVCGHPILWTTVVDPDISVQKVLNSVAESNSGEDSESAVEYGYIRSRDFTGGDTVEHSGASRYLNLTDVFFPVGGEGLASIVRKVVAKCPLDIRRSVASNVVVGGGGSMFTGLRHRLAEELSDSASFFVPEPAFPGAILSWTGASLLCSSSTTEIMEAFRFPAVVVDGETSSEGSFSKSDGYFASKKGQARAAASFQSGYSASPHGEITVAGIGLV